VQGKRLKLNIEYQANLDSIFYELTSASDKGLLKPKSAMSADIVSIGDSWLGDAIGKGLIEPIKNAQEQDWFRNLSQRWKVRSFYILFSHCMYLGKDYSWILGLFVQKF
jgi:spermidine/putrescine-binding protein